MDDVLKSFAKLRRSFARSERGNVVAMFAIMLPLLLTTVGAAIDYSRAANARSAMQAAADTAALMISKEASGLTPTEVTTKAQAYFNALFNRTDVGSVTFNAVYSANSGNGASIVVNASTSMPTDFMKLANINQMPLNVSSTTRWGNMRYRVALALDNTGSMASDDKMGQLKIATNKLINDFYDMAGGNDDIYISIIPFSKDVNLGSTNYNAPWVRFDEWEAEPAIMSSWLSNSANRTLWEQTGPGKSCPLNNSNHGFGCASTPTGTSTTSYVPSSGSFSGYICPSTDTGNRSAPRAGIQYNGCYNSVASTKTISTGWSASCGTAVNCSCSGSGSSRACQQNYYEHTWIKNARSTWNGCATDRDQNYDVGNAVPSSSSEESKAPAEQYSYCPVPILGMTSVKASKQTLLDKVDDMTPTGNTNQAIGLAWAWLTHSTSAPFPAPSKNSGYTYVDVIILLTDGENTQNRWTNAQSSIDTRESTLCTNIKATKIKIFAVQVATSGDATSAMLKNCTSEPDNPNYFSYITQASQMSVKFQNIFKELAKLRIAV
jgi:Flp pilus assembly protein TadG